MFELSVQSSFSAAHQVIGYPGDCAGLHGHTYRVEVRIRITDLDKLGMALDFRKIKSCLNETLKKLDHKNLNELPFFKKHNTTAEWIAIYIYEKIKKKIKGLYQITVWEGNDYSVTYRPENI